MSFPLNDIDWNPETWLTNTVFHVTEEFEIERSDSHNVRTGGTDIASVLITDLKMPTGAIQKANSPRY